MRVFHFDYRYRRPLSSGGGFELISVSTGFVARVKLEGISGYPWYDVDGPKGKPFVSAKDADSAIRKTGLSGYVTDDPVHLIVHRTADKDFEEVDQFTRNWPPPPPRFRIEIDAATNGHP